MAAFVPIDHVGVDIETFDPDAVAHVMPLYYGYLMVADAIGNSGKAVRILSCLMSVRILAKLFFFSS